MFESFRSAGRIAPFAISLFLGCGVDVASDRSETASALAGDGSEFVDLGSLPYLLDGERWVDADEVGVLRASQEVFVVVHPDRQHGLAYTDRAEAEAVVAELSGRDIRRRPAPPPKHAATHGGASLASLLGRRAPETDIALKTSDHVAIDSVPSVADAAGSGRLPTRAPSAYLHYFYEHTNAGGCWFRSTVDWEFLSQVDSLNGNNCLPASLTWNDAISSTGGPNWVELYEHVSWAGGWVSLPPGSYNMTGFGFNDLASSVLL